MLDIAGIKDTTSYLNKYAVCIIMDPAVTFRMARFEFLAPNSLTSRYAVATFAGIFAIHECGFYLSDIMKDNQTLSEETGIAP